MLHLRGKRRNNYQFTLRQVKQKFQSFNVESISQVSSTVLADQRANQSISEAKGKKHSRKFTFVLNPADFWGCHIRVLED